MRYVGERVGERVLLALELVDGEVEPRDDLVDLACEDGELAFAHVAQAYVALAREHAVEVRRHVVERAVADRREGREDARDDRPVARGAQHAATSATVRGDVCKETTAVSSRRLDGRREHEGRASRPVEQHSRRAVGGRGPDRAQDRARRHRAAHLPVLEHHALSLAL